MPTPPERPSPFMPGTEASGVPRWDTVMDSARQGRRRRTIIATIAAIGLTVALVLVLLWSRPPQVKVAATPTVAVPPQPLKWVEMPSVGIGYWVEFAVDTSQHPTAYSCVNQNTDITQSGGSLVVQHSTDGAQTWQDVSPLPAAFRVNDFCRLVEDPLNGNALSVETDSSANTAMPPLLTLDGGHTWQVLPEELEVTSLATYGQNVYLTDDLIAAFLVSHDGGKTWTSALNDATSPARPQHVWVDSTTGNILISVIDELAAKESFWQSTDHLATWTRLATVPYSTPTLFNETTTLARMLPSGKWAICVYFSCSLDSGQHWKEAKPPGKLSSAWVMDDRGDIVAFTDSLAPTIFRFNAQAGTWTKLGQFSFIVDNEFHAYFSIGQLWIYDYGSVYRATYQS